MPSLPPPFGVPLSPDHGAHKLSPHDAALARWFAEGRETDERMKK